MHKKILALLLLLCLLPTFALAQEKKVYHAGETEPFAEGEKLLTLRVCPIFGADAMLLTYGEHSMFVDAGKIGHINELLAALEAEGLDQAEYAFNTHPHTDHIGGILPLTREHKIGTFITVFPHDYAGPEVLQRKVIRTLEENNVPVMDVKDNDHIDFGDVNVTVYCEENGKTDNQRSGVLYVQYGDCTLLLTGDAEGEVQELLMAHHNVDVDIMKFPHHGLSRVNARFLEAVDPELVFIPHGAQDTKAAQKQLAKAGIDTMFANWGTIVMQTNGEKWIVDQEVPEKLKHYVENYTIE